MPRSKACLARACVAILLAIAAAARPGPDLSRLANAEAMQLDALHSATGRSLKQDCTAGDVACFCTAQGTAGYFADVSTGCQNWYWCTGGDQGFYQACGAGALFSQATKICDYPERVMCGDVMAATPTPTATPTPEGPTPEPTTPTSEAAPLPEAAASSCTSTEPSPPDATGVAALLSPALWCQIFVHSGDSVCSPGFYTYQSFITATAAFPEFATSAAEDATNRRELAAFLAQISHETTGGPLENNLYDWGLCFHEEVGAPSNYCVEDPNWPCAPGASYHGRGPVQLSYNYNYGQVGEALGLDLLSDPDQVSDNGTIAFETALWFWMTPQPPKPSAHDVMAGRYVPTQADFDAGRVAGYGLVTNIINGGLECGADNALKESAVAKVNDRINYFKRYAELLGVDTGENLNCSSQQPFAFAPVVTAMAVESPALPPSPEAAA